MGLTGQREADSESLAAALVGRPVRLLFLGVTAGALVVAAAGLSLPAPVRYVPLALSVVLLGLPHGAVDHLVPARLDGQNGVPRVSRRVGAAAVGIAYLLLGGVYVLVWLRAPRVAALAFIVLTWVHWGQGDVWVLRQLYDATHLRDRATQLGTLVVRGGLPMLVPLLSAPARYRAVVAAWVALFDASLNLAWLFAPATRAALGGSFAGLTLVTLAFGRWRVAAAEGGTRAWRADAAEVGVLWAFFLVVPPVVAVGLYFTIWHALRHVVRLALLEDASLAEIGLDDASTASATAQIRDAAARFVRDALPLTLLSLVLLAGFGAIVPGSVRTVPEYAALYLVFISVVTLPHVVVVALMDRAEGLWTDIPTGSGVATAERTGAEQ